MTCEILTVCKTKVRLCDNVQKRRAKLINTEVQTRCPFDVVDDHFEVDVASALENFSGTDPRLGIRREMSGGADASQSNFSRALQNGPKSRASRKKNYPSDVLTHAGVKSFLFPSISKLVNFSGISSGIFNCILAAKIFVILLRSCCVPPAAVHQHNHVQRKRHKARRRRYQNGESAKRIYDSLSKYKHLLRVEVGNASHFLGSTI